MRTTLLSTALVALSFFLFEGNAEASHSRGPYSVDILINGVPQPVFMSGGQAFVAGAYGAAYQIRVHNQSGRRIEAVVAVDGRDVITGQPVNPRRHRGYLVSPWGTASVDGFRSSSSSVAAFRFSTIPRSYAWRTGTAWGIGTIRVWVYDEAVPQPPRVVVPYGLPHSGRRSRPSSGGLEGGAAPSAPRDMGTEYGEQRWSPVTHTRFLRRSSGANAVLGIRYQSRQALMAAGILYPTPHRPVYYREPVYCVGCEWGPYPYAAPPPGYPY
jgi:hypothetical protein